MSTNVVDFQERTRVANEKSVLKAIAVVNVDYRKQSPRLADAFADLLRGGWEQHQRSSCLNTRMRAVVAPVSKQDPENNAAGCVVFTSGSMSRLTVTSIAMVDCGINPFKTQPISEATVDRVTGNFIDKTGDDAGLAERYMFQSLHLALKDLCYVHYRAKVVYGVTRSNNANVDEVAIEFYCPLLGVYANLSHQRRNQPL